MTRFAGVALKGQLFGFCNAMEKTIAEVWSCEAQKKPLCFWYNAWDCSQYDGTSRNSNNEIILRVEQNNPLPHIRYLFLSKKLAGWIFFQVSLLLSSVVGSIKQHSHLLFNLGVGCDTKGDGRRAKTLRSILYENKEQKFMAYILMTGIFQNLANKTKKLKKKPKQQNSSQKYFHLWNSLMGLRLFPQDQLLWQQPLLGLCCTNTCMSSFCTHHLQQTHLLTLLKREDFCAIVILVKNSQVQTCIMEQYCKATVFNLKNPSSEYNEFGGLFCSDCPGFPNSENCNCFI